MKRRIAIAALSLAVLGTALDAYVFLNDRWPDGSILMQLQLGSSGTLIDGSTSWGQSAEGALATWNSYVNRVQFRVTRDSTVSTGDNNGFNNVFWSDAIYGRSFGNSTLAVTTNWYRVSTGTRTEADVIFNTAWSWNSYSGTLRNSSNGGYLIDFRRVALHEFGHVLGLNHPDESGQSVSAIMNSRTSNVDRLQPDDIAGAAALYGGGSVVGPPGAPSGLVVGANGSTVSLTWRAPTAGGAPGAYVIEAGSVASAVNLANFSTGNTSLSYSAGGIGAGVYYVRVRATNGSGVSAPSNEAILLVGSGCSSAPTAPTALVGSANGSTVTLNWGASGGNPTAYIVEAGSAPGLVNLANSDTGSVATSLTAPGVGKGVYYVRVRGKNTCGVGPRSNEIVVIVP